jgi:anti-anti-sigma factor
VARPRPEIVVQTLDVSVTVLELLGEHDMANVDELRKALEEALPASRGIVVDLSKTEFIDSAVVHALLEACAMLQARGGQLVIQLETDSMSAVTATPSSLSGTEMLRWSRSVRTSRSRVFASTGNGSPNGARVTDVRSTP